MAINKQVDCNKWRQDTASQMSLTQSNVLCEVTRLPFDPNSLVPPPVFNPFTPPSGGSGSKFPWWAILIICLVGGGLCIFPLALFVLFRRRKVSGCLCELGRLARAWS